MSCDVHLLDGITYFDKLQGDNRQALAEVLDHLKLKSGQVLYRQGDPGEAIYVVRKGAVELSIKDVTGEKIRRVVIEIEGQSPDDAARAIEEASRRHQ